MAKTDTPLNEKINALPRHIVFKDHIEPELLKAGISNRTFQRDRKAKPNSIPHARLQVYAALLDCEVADLIDSFVKVTPLVKRRKFGQRYLK